MDPLFLSLEEVLELHDVMLLLYGGEAGVRDGAALEAALAMPASGAGDVRFHPDVFAMAGAYLYHLAADHPFVDGNKRTAAAAADVFLETNGYHVPPEAQDAFTDLVFRVASGSATKEEAAAFFRTHARPVGPR
jgi:death-on-curing protein